MITFSGPVHRGKNKGCWLGVAPESVPELEPGVQITDPASAASK